MSTTRRRDPRESLRKGERMISGSGSVRLAAVAVFFQIFIALGRCTGRMSKAGGRSQGGLRFVNFVAFPCFPDRPMNKERI